MIWKVVADGQSAMGYVVLRRGAIAIPAASATVEHVLARDQLLVVLVDVGCHTLIRRSESPIKLPIPSAEHSAPLW